MKFWDILDCKMGMLFPARQREEYTAVLRRRLIFATAMNVLGLIGLAAYFLLVHDSQLPAFAQGFYLGACFGIEIGAMVLQVRLRHLRKHADARQRAQLEECDEREQAILQKAFQFSAVTSIFIAVAALLVLVAVDLNAFLAVLSMLVVLCLTFLAGYLYYSRKM